MADSLQNRGPRDASRVNTSESWELDYWSAKFGVTKDRLIEAVKAVGSSSSNVEKYLQGK